jgi:hypothetical protein
MRAKLSYNVKIKSPCPRIGDMGFFLWIAYFPV